MSHCTKFDFAYSSEDAIVKAFHKLGISCSTELVCDFSSEFSKKVLGQLGYLGNKQYRSIVGKIEEDTQFFLCKVEENNYQLFIEHSRPQSTNDSVLADKFRNAYIEVAIDKVIKKLDLNAIHYETTHKENGKIVNFGPNLEYTLSVLAENGSIIEEVSGVKGDICTKLTEDIEDVLSQPTSELRTEWKTEVEMQVEDTTLQILSLNF